MVRYVVILVLAAAAAGIDVHTVQRDHTVVMPNGDLVDTATQPSLQVATARGLGEQDRRTFVLHVARGSTLAQARATIGGDAMPYAAYNAFTAPLTLAEARALSPELVDWVDVWLTAVAPLVDAPTEQGRRPTPRAVSEDLSAAEAPPGCRRVRVGISRHAASADELLARVHDRWSERLPPPVVIGAVSRRIVQLDYCAATLAERARIDAAVEQLAQDDAEIRWVEPVMATVALNEHASALLQDAGPPARTTLWTQAGITGAGEVVGVADTGLDLSHCAFYDPAMPAPAANAPLTGHRKLALYQTSYGGTLTTDMLDVAGGHGTHVVGTVLGAPRAGAEGSSGRMRGVAYGAKVAFADIQRSVGLDNPYLDVPGDLGDALLPDAYAAGARVHSNSWGSSVNRYTSTAQQFDEFAWEHPHFLAVAAAGNSGSS